MGIYMINNTRYLLLGLGIGNKAVKDFLEKHKFEFLIYDDYIKEYKKDIDYNMFDVLVKTSGINDDHFIIRNARRLDKIIISDLELFYHYSLPKKIICVTGSNGKTTTVSLIHHILSDLDLGGNIGHAVCNFIESSKDIIIEASSFMLDYTNNFHANINVYTNLYTNHLDHHDSLKSYIKAKLKLIQNIKKDDYIIYNHDDILVRRLFENLDVRKIPFSKFINNGVYIKDNNIYYNGKLIYNISNIKLMGEHNIYNILACSAVVCAHDIGKIQLLKRLDSFVTLDHRIEYLGEINGAKIYNDSKSTNFIALKSSLNTFKDKDVLLICGGKLKEDDFSMIKDELKQIKFVIINGENRVLLSNFFKKNRIDHLILKDLESVCDVLLNYINGVDVVLFSPGSSSYDQFNNFEVRGIYFKNRIAKLIN